MSGHLTCSENLAYSAFFGRNSDKLTTFRIGKPNFSGPSNNGLSYSEVKPSILKSAYSTTLSLYTTIIHLYLEKQPPLGVIRSSPRLFNPSSFKAKTKVIAFKMVFGIHRNQHPKWKSICVNLFCIFSKTLTKTAALKSFFLKNGRF